MPQCLAICMFYLVDALMPYVLLFDICLLYEILSLWRWSCPPFSVFLQSDRFFNALKGHGALCRLVILPFESHGYSARESVLHVLWETDRWLQTYCVNNSDKLIDLDVPKTDTLEDADKKVPSPSGGGPNSEGLEQDGYHSRQRSLLW